MGYLDYWSGSLTPDESRRYDVDAVLNSTVAGVLSRVYDDGRLLTSKSIASLRNESTVRCDFVNNTTPCKPFRRPCLFNIVRDPCERVNLNYAPGDKMKKFVQAKIDDFERSLRKFGESARRPGNVRGTKSADPALHNKTWTNWEDAM